MAQVVEKSDIGYNVYQGFLSIKEGLTSFGAELDSISGEVDQSLTDLENAREQHDRAIRCGDRKNRDECLDKIADILKNAKLPLRKIVPLKQKIALLSENQKTLLASSRELIAAQEEKVNEATSALDSIVGIKSKLVSINAEISKVRNSITDGERGLLKKIEAD